MDDTIGRTAWRVLSSEPEKATTAPPSLFDSDFTVPEIIEVVSVSFFAILLLVTLTIIARMQRKKGLRGSISDLESEGDLRQAADAGGGRGLPQLTDEDCEGLPHSNTERSLMRGRSRPKAPLQGTEPVVGPGERNARTGGYKFQPSDDGSIVAVWVYTAEEDGAEDLWC